MPPNFLKTIMHKLTFPKILRKFSVVLKPRKCQCHLNVKFILFNSLFPCCFDIIPSSAKINSLSHPWIDHMPRPASIMSFVYNVVIAFRTNFSRRPSQIHKLQSCLDPESTIKISNFILFQKLILYQVLIIQVVRFQSVEYFVVLYQYIRSKWKKFENDDCINGRSCQPHKSATNLFRIPDTLHKICLPDLNLQSAQAL